MNTTILRVSACIAWAGALLASAAPADATAFTAQIGAYASCSGAYETYPNSFETCEMKAVEYVPGYVYTTEYKQIIKLVSTTCGAGGCQSDERVVYTDVIYGAGRKTTTLYDNVCAAMKMYGFGTCAC
jgi:hypothetical protein